ncbi:hypothetical protein GGX14DRAFT_701437, partial [Mycena pura]
MSELFIDDSTITWANRALLSAAVILFYDFLLTVMSELELYRHFHEERKLIGGFLALRYLATLYQLLMVFAIIDNRPTYGLSYVGIIFWRVRVVNGIWIAVPLATLGLTPPIIDASVSNPSVFPACRALSAMPTARTTGASARIIIILPCLRAAFDAATSIALFFKLWRHIASMGALASKTVAFVLTEEVKDIILIFAIMAMEAVFAQIPSARTHARNFIVPFVDSITPILATRFMLELAERTARAEQSQHTSTRARAVSLTLVASEVPGALGDPPSSLH